MAPGAVPGPAAVRPRRCVVRGRPRRAVGRGADPGAGVTGGTAMDLFGCCSAAIIRRKASRRRSPEGTNSGSTARGSVAVVSSSSSSHAQYSRGGRTVSPLVPAAPARFSRLSVDMPSSAPKLVERRAIVPIPRAPTRCRPERMRGCTRLASSVPSPGRSLASSTSATVVASVEFLGSESMVRNL